MAREILFKAKRECNGEWVEGSPVFYESGEVAIFNEKFTRYGHEATQIWKRTLVDKDTLCQYTGLTDKNGNKIWENDVVQNDAYSYTECEGDVCGQIVYSDAYASFGLLLKDRFVTIYDLQGSYKTIYEVLGNAFDNPELLKEE